MRTVRFALTRAVALLPALLSWGCAKSALVPPPRWEPASKEPVAPSADDGLLCRGIAERSISLPKMSGTKASHSTSAVPSAGRWTVRQCSAKAQGAELAVRLAGPGWYWVDQTGHGVRVRQRVPFELSLELRGRLHESTKDGVVSLWFVPSAEPVVQVEAPPELEVQPVTLWGNLLSVVPGVSPARVAARRFKEQLAEAFVAHLRDGATFTYDLRSGQPDVALGQLAPGTTPQRALRGQPL